MVLRGLCTVIETADTAGFSSSLKILLIVVDGKVSYFHISLSEREDDVVDIH